MIELNFFQLSVSMIIDLIVCQACEFYSLHLTRVLQQLIHAALYDSADSTCSAQAWLPHHSFENLCIENAYAIGQHVALTSSYYTPPQICDAY